MAGLPPAHLLLPITHLGEEKHRESKVSCLRTQHNDPSQGPNPDHPIRTNHKATAPPLTQH